MRKLTILFLPLVFALTGLHAQAGDNWRHGYRVEDVPGYEYWMNKAANETRTNVHAVSPYNNPYYQPNPNYEPRKIGNPEWVINDQVGKMGKPPRGLLDIIVKGTYTIKVENVPKTHKHFR